MSSHTFFHDLGMPGNVEGWYWDPKVAKWKDMERPKQDWRPGFSCRISWTETYTNPILWLEMKCGTEGFVWTLYGFMNHNGTAVWNQQACDENKYKSTHITIINECLFKSCAYMYTVYMIPLDCILCRDEIFIWTLDKATPKLESCRLVLYAARLFLEAHDIACASSFNLLYGCEKCGP